MQIQVTTKDEDGNVAFTGTLSKTEVSFVLNVGINTLLANGALPLFTGKDDSELGIVAKAPTSVQ